MRTPTILHHFTSEQHLAKIKQGGIALGAIPFRLLPTGKVTFMRGLQWLTTDPEWEQSWAAPELSLLPYRKNEYRLTIEFPIFAMSNLIHWMEYRDTVRPPSAGYLNGFRGYPHWWLYEGTIPFAWVSQTTRNPVPINLAHLNEI